MKNRKKTRRNTAWWIIAPMAAVLSPLSSSARAGNSYTWRAGDTAQWDDENSWTNDATGTAHGYPTANDEATLGEASAGTVNLGTMDAVDTLTFANNLTPYTLSGFTHGTATLSVNSIQYSSFFGVTGLGITNIFDSATTLASQSSALLPIQLAESSLEIDGNLNAPGGIDVSETVPDDSSRPLLTLNGMSNIIGSIALDGTSLTVAGPKSLGGASVVQFNQSPANFNQNNISAQFGSSDGTGNYGCDLSVSGGVTAYISSQASAPVFGKTILSGGVIYFNTGTAYTSSELDLNGNGVITTGDSYFNAGIVTFTGGIVDLTGGSSPYFLYGRTTLGATATNLTGSVRIGANYHVPTYVLANASGALGSGSLEIEPTGGVNFAVAQSSFQPTNVEAYGAIGGNLTGAVYGSSLTLAANSIILAGTTNLPTRAYAGGANYYLGIVDPTGSYTVGDAQTNLFKGAALGEFTTSGGFTGSITEAVPGQGIQLYAAGEQAIGNPTTGASATFNTTNTTTGVTILSDQNLTSVGFYEPLAGTATVYNLVSANPAAGSNPDWYAETSGVIPSSVTVNVQNGTFITDINSDDVKGTLNIYGGASLLHNTNSGVGPTIGAFHLAANSTFIIQTTYGGGTQRASGIPGNGATYTWDVGSVLDESGYNGTLSTASAVNPSVSWFSPNSDLLVDAQVAFTGKGITLGNGRRISTTSGAILSGGAGITAASSAGTIILSAADNTTLDITDNVTTPQTLQIGSTPWSYNGLSQSGTVILDGTVNVGTLNLVAGALEIAKGATNVTITNTTVGAAATIEGGGTNINATRLDLFGHISPGHSPGQFATGAATTFEAGSQYQWQINHEGGTPGNEAAGWDLFTTSSSLSLLATPSDPMTVTVESLDPNQNPDPVDDFDPTKPMAFAFIQDASLSGFNPAAFSLDLSQFQNAYDGTWSVQEEPDGTTLDIVYTPTAVPEPASLSLLALGAFVLKRRRVNPD